MSKYFLRENAPFVGLKGTSTLDGVIENACLNAGVTKKPYRSFHSLRRSFGTWMAKEEVPITTISQMLGHADMDSSKPYLSFDEKQMLDLKEAIGYSRVTYQPHIKEFIVFCGNTYPEAVCVTKEMVDTWLQQKQFQTNATHNSAISRLRAFTKYQAAIGKDTFVPGEEYSVKTVHYTPYIFTDVELRKLFKTFDTLQPHFEAPEREYIVPVLFRMMYCCGMRPSEPLELLYEDVNLQTGEIYIRQSKRKKDRRILMSEDLMSLCRRYASFKKPRTYFFDRVDGSRFPTYWMTNQFRICWRNSGLVKRGNPRPYDLRHNYAKRTMMRWVNEGRDVMAMVSYLSAYMGHTEFSATLYYIHLLPERLIMSSGIDGKDFHVYIRRLLMKKIKDPELFKTIT
ncbi:tyrosine-type recombinase/integrase [Desulfosporosinus sp. BICA1-9]|uniref:tyrosine-type recombinase/integrase n=1 Tax=Desulfosporosinus sp. BICA1-9 TaxID=1531958 RepID=UPI00054C7FB0|nr:tyrosine-type recombinase/integrase [Desulfosporosinus sp. BICA1-9]KJS46403.1 MAG: hypothetical protein VR66_25620 [Peptococcaceae bacterium BRH_c23]KJS89722.1 MAG: hypothetical protein JL57_05505 [Desulfosporosinus sp. BICA1-9]HBW38161.1 hypothetical protein [Desulfosporosinus sp.]